MKISELWGNQNSEKTLEERLFRTIIYTGILAVFFLLIYDGFYTREYISVYIELFAGLCFFVFFFLIKNKSIPKAYNHYLILILIICVNLSWITGTGINLMNGTIYFLWLVVALLLHGRRSYPLIFGWSAINLLLLFLFQTKTEVFEGKLYAAENHLVINHYISMAFLVFVGGYLVAYLKINYNHERTNLHRLNKLLNEKSLEITHQNEELKMSKDALDRTIFMLENRTSELLKVKQTLEEKVNERTEDLMKLNERLLNQNQQLEQFAYITSHNLRSPVAQIKGLVNLLPASEHFDALTRETLNLLSKSVGSLDRVVSDLSEILRVEKGLHRSWQNVDLLEELHGVLDSLASVINSHGIKVKVPASEPLIVKALKPFVYSVLSNIIENAVKYVDYKKDHRFIRFEFGDVDKYLVMRITDNGIGIDMDIASGKIFSMYQRFNNTHPGQGFGLYLVKSQMEAMEGKVELESILSQGTTFNLYFLKR